MNVRPRIVARASGLLLLCAVGCASGTETDNPAEPLVRFEGSVCKKEAAQTSEVPGQSSEAFVTASDYDGLSCIEWERREGGELGLKFSNVEGPCSVPWEGSVKKTGNGLDVVASNPTCEIAPCGWCLYDFELTVARTEPTGLGVTLGLVSCAGEAPQQSEAVTLPADASDSGILCRYAHGVAFDEQLAVEGRCGARFGPCASASSYCGPNGSCADGLVCTDVGGTIGSMRCLDPCETDADCTPVGVTRCADGVCTVPAAF